MRTFAKITPILKERWGRYAWGVIVLLLVDGLQLLIPKIIQYTIDAIGGHTITQTQILYRGLWVVGLAAGIMILRYWWRVLIMGNAWYLEKKLRSTYYQHLLTLSRNWFNHVKIGDLMARATNDLNSIRMMFGMGFVAIAEVFILLFAAAGFMVSINWKLTLIAIIPMPFMSLTVAYFGKRMHVRFAKVQGAFSALSGSVQETISGIRVVKAFNQEERELDKMNIHGYEYIKRNLKLALISGAFHPSMGLVISISMTLALIWGGIFTVEGDMTTGQFISFFSYLGMLAWPVMAIGFSINLYQTGTASLKRINKIFEATPEVIDETPDQNITGVKGDIEIKDLHFKYQPDTAAVFNGISTKVTAGQTLAVMGRTGCGKSSLIDLLVRVYNPPKGHIFIDGREIYDIPLQVLRSSLVMVPQDIFLFSDTIADNIRLGNPQASIEQVHRVAQLAQVHDDIIGFDKGYETMVGERGVTLSGGQKQRIAIARALLANPDILILDDSLSAVDTKTEKQILEHLITERANRTTIIVAHRVSSIEHADQIIFLADGKIAESGTHNQLLDLGGLYRELYDRQQLEDQLEN